MQSIQEILDVVDPLALVVGSGCATVVLASALAYVVSLKSSESREDVKEEATSMVESHEEIDKSIYPGGLVTLYYGTQTGTAESFAKQIEREGEEHGFMIRVVDMEDVVEVGDMVQKQCLDVDSGIARSVFISSTYGEGESPDNAVDFVMKLTELTHSEILFEESKETEGEPPEPILSKMEYCVFGLGSGEYEHFNAIGKFLNFAMDKLGAKRVIPVGLGDDAKDIEADFDSWKDDVLWPTLEKLYIKDVSAIEKLHHTPAKEALPDAQYKIQYHSKETKAKDIELDHVHGLSKHYFTSYDCPVSKIRELRSAEDGGSTVHMEIDISNEKELVYETADNLGVLPLNRAAAVESIAELLGFDLDAVFSLTEAPHHEWHGAPFPMPISVRECLTRYCDITGLLRRSDLKLLAAYATDPTDKKVLLRMASKEGKAEYREKVLEGHVGLVDILKLCPSTKMPLEHFLSICPLLQTRFYTISSSSSVHPSSVHITVAVTETTLTNGSVFKGVCSNHLADLQVGDKVRVFNRASTFRLPKDSSRPIVMIGPGTGIAPMRALLQERAHQRDVNKAAVGKNVLYFGCKKASMDYIYEDELATFKKDGILNELHLAFSREQTEKVYVQHLLAKNAEETWKLINTDGAFVFVCGGVKMGHDVSEALKTIFTVQGGMTAEEAKDLLSSLSKDGRYVQELWS